MHPTNITRSLSTHSTEIRTGPRSMDEIKSAYEKLKEEFETSLQELKKTFDRAISEIKEESA